MRSIVVGVSDLLSLVSCADDYGFNDDVLMGTLADWLGRRVSDEEIELCARKLLDEHNEYSDEDYEACKSKLKAFQHQYCSAAGSDPET